MRPNVWKETEKQYPRVLILNRQSIYKENATGITMRSLWADWPGSHVLEIHVDGQNGHHAEDNAIQSIGLPIGFIEKYVKGKAGAHINQSLKKQTDPASSKKGMREYFRQLCVYILESFPITVPPNIWDQIVSFSPDVIYTLGGSLSILSLAYQISCRLKVGIVLHFMDNWLEHNQWEDNPFLGWYFAGLKRNARRCIKRSNVGIAISPAMAQRYSALCGLPFEVLMNMADEKMECCTPAEETGCKRFVYAGGLHLERWRALKELAESIDSKCPGGCLDIYTSDDNRERYAPYFAGLPVNFLPAVPRSQIFQIYQTASVLVHAEYPTPVLKGFFKYSISTKIPEYLSAGRPVLFYGPSDIGLYQYLEDNQAALLADTREKLDAVIAQLATDSRQEDMVANAVNLAKKNHNSKTGRENLRRIMLEATRGCGV